MRAFGSCLLLVGVLSFPSVVFAAKKPAPKAAAKKPAAKPAKKAPAKKAVAKAPKPKPAPKVYGPPQLIFTFDDGPAGDRTVKVLDLLDQHKIKAVFFVNGVRFAGESKLAEREKEHVREELKRGHIVGNHTVHHYFLCGKVYSKIADKEIEDNAKLIEATIGSRPPLYRTPFGAHCPTLTAVHGKLGVRHTGWDLDPQDWKLKDAKKIEATVIAQIKGMRGKNILLMHDIQQATVDALPKILDWLDAENERRKKANEPVIEILHPSVLLAPPPVPTVAPTPTPPPTAPAPTPAPAPAPATAAPRPAY